MPARRTRRISAALLSLASALAVASCSSASTTPSSATSTGSGSGSPHFNLTSAQLCALASPAQVQSVLGLSVQNPYPSGRSPITRCIYLLDNQTVVGVSIRYDTASSASVFAGDRSLFAKDGQNAIPIHGLGDQAFYATAPSGHQTITSVIVRKGNVEVSITTAAAPARVQTLASQILSQL